MTHTCLKSHLFPLSEKATIGGSEMTACKSYERKAAQMAQNPCFTQGWHILIRAERYVGSGKNKPSEYSLLPLLCSVLPHFVLTVTLSSEY